ncbi:filamentous hemagglutinin [Pseudomonas sp. URMO17WK12:I1]|uniref:two-partner secretion domain-containing protein n=1 Tax=unclassified Pseudomonas TaxID=196821 RepID=UPI0004B39866|nr:MULTISPECIES: DUF637 domain-containing protein [unclassified Pseudomonas]PZW63606.1 filamentous hemagglutinin [Pseudomonas sp. URMO17WK12:I1]
MDVRSPLNRAIARILIGVMLFDPVRAVAAELAVDAAAGGNTSIGQAGNGVPVVNIATPNGKGLSHNKFTDYNVGQQGLILNNGAQAFVPSQLGGYIKGNPNLKGGAAGVILNEVTGSNRSQLKGYTEVAGQGAHVIVANPHGITCDGCGFINTPRATLSTGEPKIQDGRLKGFDVEGGDIAIEGAGLNASNVDQFDLISRTAKINADIYAKRLNVVAGRNEVDVDTLQAKAKADDGREKPRVAIDSTALGGMYAGAISLVGTEKGVGVNLAGDMAATAGDIQIDASGQLTMNRSAASGNTTLVADSVDLKGDTYAGGTARVEAKQVDVRESLAAGEQVKVQAERLNNAGAIEAGVRADGSTNSAGHLQLDGGSVRNEGQLVSHGSLNTDLQKLDNADGQIAAAGSATLTAKELDNQKGQVVAQGNLTLDTDTLNNRQGSALAGQALAIEAEAVDNQAGTLAAGGAITAKVTNALNNDGGLVEAGGHLDVQADSLSNTKGRLRALGSAGESRFTIGKQLNNDDGLLEVGSAVLTFDTESLSNKDGVVRHLGSAGLNLDMQLLGQAGGEFITNSAVSLSAEEWVNDSLLQAASITLDIDRLTQTAGGGLLAVNSLSTTGESWINDGRLETNGNLDLRLSGDYRGNGSLLALGNIDLQADNIAFGTDAKVSGGGFGRLTALGELVSQGRMTAAAWLSMAAEKIDNRGTLGAGGDLLLQADSIRNDGGLIFSGGNLQLLADRFTNRLASLYSLGHLSIAKDAQGSLASLIENRSGTFDSAGDMSLRAAVIANVRDEFQTEQGKYDAVFTELACRGPYNPTGDCKLGSNGRKVGVWQLQEYDRLIVTADSGASHITAGGSLNVLGDRLTNSSSTIASAGDLQMQLGSLDNIGVETSEVHTTRILVSGRKPSYWFYRGLVYGFNAEHAGSRNLGTLESDLNRVVGAMEREYLPANKVEQVSVDGQTYAAVIQSGGDIKVNTRDDFDSRVIRSSYAYVGGGTRVDTSTPGSDIATAITLNPQLPPDLAQKAVDPLSLPSFKLPIGKNGLFSLNTNPGHPYLIETDPAFADLGNFLSSSYLLGELDYDPNNTQKLLGDGLYEQRLIREAVLARTGQRFLAGLTSDEAQFRYLMDNAIASQQALQLSVGVGLSAEQVATLTHDIVWMEEREVSGQKVLAPVLYLAQADGRLAPNGALVQGRDLTLISGGGLSNAGTLRATANLGIQAESIGNSGLMQANQRLQLLATDSIRNAQGGIIAGRDVSLQAGNDILNERSVATHQSANGKAYEHQRQMADSAARIEAERDLSMVAGRDLLNVGGALSAGGNATLQAGQDLLLASQQTENSTSRYQNARNYSTRQQIDQYGSDVKVGGDLQAAATRDMAIVGSKVAAEGDMALQAGGSMTIASAANEYHFDAKRKGGGKKVEAVQDSVTQIASELSAGGDFRAVSGQDMNLSASRIDASGSAYLYSGGQLNLLAAQNSNYSLYDKQSKGSFGAKATRRDEVTTIRHIGTDITTGSDLTLASAGDQLYQRARLDSGADLTLQSGGGITFEGVKDLDQKSFEKSSNSLVWTSAKGKGTTDETLLQTQMIAQGEIAIKAVEGLNIDIKDVDQQTVTQTIDAMVEADPQLAWLKAAEQRGDVDWHRVKEIHDSFKYSHSGLGAGAQLVIAIIVTYLTAGAGAALTGATSTAGMAASNAVVTAAASNAAISTINNRGNLGATFKDVTSSDAMKGYAVSAFAAGFTAGVLDSAFGVTGDNVNKVTKGFDLSKASDIGKFGTYLGVQGTVQAAAQTAVQGGSFSDNLQGSLTNQVYHLMQATGFTFAGDFAEGRWSDSLGEWADVNWAEGSAQKAALHAVIGGLLSEATGGDFATGALAAGANELLVEQLSDQIKQDKNLELAVSQLVGVAAASATGGDLAKAAELTKNATAYNRQMHPEEIRLIKRQAKQMAREQGISEDEASRRMAEAFAYYTDKDWRSTISGKEVLIEESTLSNLGKALAPLANRYEAVSDVPQIGERTYTAAETLALLERYEFNHTDFFDSKINAEHLIGRTSSDWEYQDFYRNNLNYSDGVGVGAQLVGVGKGVGNAVGDTVVGTYELGKSLVTEPLSTSEQIANGIRQTAFQPNEAYASYTEARDDAQIQAALYRLQGNPEAAAKVEAQWETNFALNFAGGGSGALRKLPRSGADVWEAGPIAKGKLEADAPNLDTKPGPGGTSLAGLPEHYREGGSVGAAFNEAGGLPDGYRRVLNTKTGNTEVVSSDGVFYFETANGLRPKAGGNLAGQVEAERRIAGAKGTAQVVPDVISPTYRELQGLNKGFQAHHTLPQYLGKMLGYTKNDMLDHPATLITQYSHTGKVNPDAMHKAISKYLPPMVGGKPATYTPGQISSGLQKAYGDIGRPELFDSIKHLIK